MKELIKFIHWKHYTASFVFMFLSLTIFFISLWLFFSEKNQLLLAESSLAQQKSINETAENAVLQLSTYNQQYQHLKDQGLVGEPPRLDWAEVLLEKYNDIKIPGFYFALSPTQLSQPEQSFLASDLIDIKRTPMQITFNLLHEGDFYRYFSQLHRQAKGQFSVQECDITRGLNSNNGQPIELNGQCQIIWFSMADISAKWPQGLSL